MLSCVNVPQCSHAPFIAILDSLFIVYTQFCTQTGSNAMNFYIHNLQCTYNVLIHAYSNIPNKFGKKNFFRQRGEK